MLYCGKDTYTIARSILHPVNDMFFSPSFGG
jgi:hypothetical protein